MRAWGLDGCKGGWFYAGFDGSHWEYGVVGTVRNLLDKPEVPDDATVLIDIPIGLPAAGTNGRECDTAARKALAPDRRSSVFSVPCREAVYAKTYDDAQAANRDALGRGLSKQSWGIAPKIREVDELLIAEPKLRETIREIHPEVCFWGLAGDPMKHNKKTREGSQERLEIIEKLVPGAREAMAKAFLEYGGFEAARDDILDAMVAAICAHHIDRCSTLPESPPRDEKGLPMEMVYVPRDAVPGT